MSRDVVVAARGLTKSYGDFVAVRGIEFSIARGECFGFLGPNGAGKTTTMRMIYRASPVDSGELTVLGFDVRTDVNDRAVKRQLGVVPQLDNLDEQLTVRENLDVFTRFYGLRGEQAKSRVAQLLEFAELTSKADAKVITLSGGMRRRLLVARGLMGEPDCVVLDEPTTGLDPRAREKLWDKLAALRERGATLVLTTHYMREAERLCDRVAIMDEGQVVAIAPPDELISQHVAPFVVELRRRPDDPDSLADVAPSLHGAAVRVDAVRDRFLLHAEDGEALIALAAREVADRQPMLRRASLEDVFLRITGKGLDG